jgi:hypothetical protein
VGAVTSPTIVAVGVVGHAVPGKPLLDPGPPVGASHPECLQHSTSTPHNPKTTFVFSSKISVELKIENKEWKMKKKKKTNPQKKKKRKKERK